MTTPQLEKLDIEAKDLESKISQVIERDSDDDMTDDEELQVRAWTDELEKLTERRQMLAKALTVSDEARTKLARVPSRTAPDVNYRSSGEVLHDMLRPEDADAQARVRSLTRAAQHMGTDATKTVATAGDLGGLRIDPIVGPVLFPQPEDMPFLSALGLNPAPSITFMRPHIIDASFATAAGPHAGGLEKAELPSAAFTVDAQNVTLTTIGSYLNVSLELQEFQPGALTMIVNHLTRRVAAAMEKAAVAELSSSSGSLTLAADADAAAIQQALWDASAAVWKSTGTPASWVLMGPDGASRLGGLTDAAGRPLFPALSPSNAPGTGDASTLGLSTVAGLRPVVSAQITDANFWVGNMYGMEAWVRWFPILEAIEPSVLGRQVARAAAFAAVRPTATADSAVHLAP